MLVNAGHNGEDAGHQERKGCENGGGAGAGAGAGSGTGFETNVVSSSANTVWKSLSLRRFSRGVLQQVKFKVIIYEARWVGGCRRDIEESTLRNKGLSMKGIHFCIDHMSIITTYRAFNTKQNTCPRVLCTDFQYCNLTNTDIHDRLVALDFPQRCKAVAFWVC